jgi:DHA2 family multidrug resistance protein
MFSMGVTLFSAVVMMPQFLQSLMGYTAETAGMVLSAGAVLVVLQLPLIGRLTSVVPAKYLIACGWLLMALAMYLSTQRTDLSISFSAATWLRIAQALPISLVFIPLSVVAYIGIPREKSNAVAAIINFMRNMGASVGTSLVTTLVARQAQRHQVYLTGRLGPDDPAFREQLEGLAGQFAQAGATAYQGREQAYAALYQSLTAQARTLAFIDTYSILAIGAVVMLALTVFLKHNDPQAAGPAAGH